MMQPGPTSSQIGAGLGARTEDQLAHTSEASADSVSSWDDGDRDSNAPQGPDPLIGLVVAGRYRILECVGRGGMGVVYKIEHTEIGKLLALKLLAGELSRRREVVRRFKREAFLASKLSHPNSVQVFDFGVSDGLTYLVMELVNGVDLAKLLRTERHLPIQRFARMMIQICSSLAEAHGLGIVHRDLKPENILIARTRDGADFPKVLDFGLAKLREATELNEVTGTGQVVGTPYYMSPEQIHGRSVDNRADIYSLGAVMYVALTGHTPFHGSTPMAVFTKHLTEMPTPPHERYPMLGISQACSDIVMRALQKEPDERFQRIEDMRQALLELLLAAGDMSANRLLSSHQLDAIELDIGPSPSREASRLHHGLARTLAAGEIATRNEVEAFKRKLTRQRRTTIALAAVALVGAGCGAVHLYQRATAKPEFQGVELEPNNQASEANDVPIGQTVRARIGKRIDAARSDRDFFRIQVPSADGAHAHVSIRVTALPNMPTCTWIYRVGEVEPRARFCTGQPSRDLLIPSYRTAPGTYLFAVMQDRDTPFGRAGFVMENVSDEYELRVESAMASDASEVEPNDAETAATRMAPGSAMRGQLAWVEDVDFVCINPSAGGMPSKVRMVIEDAVEGPRDRGAILEVLSFRGPEAGIPFRLHRANSDAQLAEQDRVSPWTSAAFEPGPAGSETCVRLRLTADPRNPGSAGLAPPASSEHWSIRVEQAL